MTDLTAAEKSALSAAITRHDDSEFMDVYFTVDPDELIEVVTQIVTGRERNFWDGGNVPRNVPTEGDIS